MKRVLISLILAIRLIGNFVYATPHIKIFEADTKEELEKQVNEYCKKESPYVRQISYSVGLTTYSCAILLD